MSFDLYVLDLPELPEPDTLHRLLEDESGWGEPVSPRIAAVIVELGLRFPGRAAPSSLVAAPLTATRGPNR